MTWCVCVCVETLESSSAASCLFPRCLTVKSRLWSRRPNADASSTHQPSSRCPFTLTRWDVRTLLPQQSFHILIAELVLIDRSSVVLSYLIRLIIVTLRSNVKPSAGSDAAARLLTFIRGDRSAPVLPFALISCQFQNWSIKFILVVVTVVNQLSGLFSGEQQSAAEANCSHDHWEGNHRYNLRVFSNVSSETQQLLCSKLVVFPTANRRRCRREFVDAIFISRFVSSHHLPQWIWGGRSRKRGEENRTVSDEAPTDYSTCVVLVFPEQLN